MPGFDSNSLYFVREKQNLEGTSNEVCIPRAIGAARLHSSNASERRAYDERNWELIKVFSIYRDLELVIYTARRRNRENDENRLDCFRLDVKHIPSRICWISLRDKQKCEVQNTNRKYELNKAIMQYIQRIS